MVLPDLGSAYNDMIASSLIGSDFSCCIIYMCIYKMNREVLVQISTDICSVLLGKALHGAYSHAAKYRFIAYAKQFHISNNNKLMYGTCKVVMADRVDDIIAKVYGTDIAIFGRDKLYSIIVSDYYGITK